MFSSTFRFKQHIVQAFLVVMIACYGLSACGGGGSGDGSLPKDPPSKNTPPPKDDGDDDIDDDDDGDEIEDSPHLPVLHVFNAGKKALGEAMFKENVIADGLIPKLALRNLWVTWCADPANMFTCGGSSLHLCGADLADLFPPITTACSTANDATYWQAFRERYGMHEAPFNNGGYPLGVRDSGGGLMSFDCLMCHAGTVAGQTVIGVANSMLDLQGLNDDIAYLNSLAPTYGFPSSPVPFVIENITGAAGVTDAFGLAMGLTNVSGIETYYGYQRPSAWWTIKHKNHLYSDASGSVSGTGYRPMMATLLAFGLTVGDMEAKDEDFENILHYLFSLQAPAWPQSIDTEAAERGKVVYTSSCRGCHGSSSVGFPASFIALNVVGTDPLRAENFTNTEASVINTSWFGETPMTATGKYMAPPLTGIWARAPYFHNGSVPTLKAVLDSSIRPTFWKRTGSGADDFDFDEVGWRYTPKDSGGNRATIAGRKIYDTTQDGLSNSGHTFGDALTSQQRDDVIEYLKTF